jgi:hypothetical protein
VSLFPHAVFFDLEERVCVKVGLDGKAQREMPGLIVLRLQFHYHYAYGLFAFRAFFNIKFDFLAFL